MGDFGKQNPVPTRLAGRFHRLIFWLRSLKFFALQYG